MWPQVAEDECRHFLLLEARLKEMGSYYGAFQVHDGLWESAGETAHRCGRVLERQVWESVGGTAHRFGFFLCRSTLWMVEGLAPTMLLQSFHIAP